MNSGNHWIVADDPPDGGIWKGCSLCKRPDGGNYVLLSPNAMHLNDVLRLNNAHEGSLVNNTCQETAQVAEKIEFMVMGRCRHLVDGYLHSSAQSPSGKMADSLAKLHAELKGKKAGMQSFIAAAYMGFDSCMQGPVFARAAKAAAGPNPPKVMASDKPNEPNQSYDAFDLKDLIFGCDSAPSLVGHGFIPHFAMTSCANIDMLRQLLTGHSVENALRYTEISRYSRHVRKLVQDLGTGDSLSPFVYVDPDVRAYLAPGKDLRYILEHDWCCPCDENRPISQIACDTTLLARQDKDGVPSGYRYQAALVEAMEYPVELLNMLKDFATLYPNDILPLRTLLLACHLWADIAGHRTLSLERFFEKSEDQSAVPQVPDIPLAVCLIYYPHWLKWTEWMGLSEFPHPFRFMSQAVKSDMDKEAIGIDPDSIDQGRAYSLIAKAKSRIPLMDATYRLEIMPCHMPGSTMPPMFGPMVMRPEKVPLALTGLPSVQYLGLNNYVRPDNSKDERPARIQSIRRTSKYTTVALPVHVRDRLFITPGKLFEASEDPREVSNSTSNKRCMVPVGSESLRTERPHKKPRGLDVAQSDRPVAEVTTGTTSSIPAGTCQAPNCSTNEEIFAIWAKARHEIAHWAHQEGLRQFENLPEGERSREKLKALIQSAFEQENADVQRIIRGLRRMGKKQTSSNSFPLDDEYLNTDLPLALGRMLGLRPPDNPVPDLWISHFMPQCSEKEGKVYLQAQRIQSVLQVSRSCHQGQLSMIQHKIMSVVNDIQFEASDDWRERLKMFLEDGDTYTTISATEEGSLYEEGASDGENTSDEESF